MRPRVYPPAPLRPRDVENLGVGAVLAGLGLAPGVRDVRAIACGCCVTFALPGLEGRLRVKVIDELEPVDSPSSADVEWCEA